LNKALSFYESLLNAKPGIRFTYPEMNIELASIGDFLLLAGSPESLKPFMDTKATLIVDSIERFENKGKIF
jgi:hypothetical protein